MHRTAKIINSVILVTKSLRDLCVIFRRHCYGISTSNVPKLYPSGAELDEDFVEDIEISAVTAVQYYPTSPISKFCTHFQTMDYPKTNWVRYGA